MSDWARSGTSGKRATPRSPSSTRPRVRPLLLAAFCTPLLIAGVRAAIAQDAPYGLSWGPLDKVPRPSTADREANITALIYRGDRLPSGTPDTSEIVLEVCANEGLQNVIWVSRPLTEDESKQKWDAIIAEGNRRNGAPVADSDGNRVTWPGGRVSVALAHARNGTMHVLMTSGGPAFQTCSVAHFNATNHNLQKHFEDIIRRLALIAP